MSVLATDYTVGLSKEAICILFKFLPRAYNNGPRDYEARERVHTPFGISPYQPTEGQLPARTPGAGKLKALCDAPGEYVRVKA